MARWRWRSVRRVLTPLPVPPSTASTCMPLLTRPGTVITWEDTTTLQITTTPHPTPRTGEMRWDERRGEERREERRGETGEFLAQRASNAENGFIWWRHHEVSDFYFLGIILHGCATWKPHIDKLASKLSRNAGILNKLKNFLPAFIMKSLYFSLSHSHSNYGILIWGYRCNRLVKLQKRLIRIVMLAKYNAHTDPLFKQSAILKISDMLSVNALKF